MSAQPDARAHMTALVQETVAQILPGVPRAQITGDKHLRELGADSVDRVEIILSLIDRLRLDEPMSNFSDLPDLDALVDFLVQTGCALT
jgi:polyketide biosynthesis acyl carrier protein